MESLLFNADVIKGAAQQLPILIVLWYMMKEIQKKQAATERLVDDLAKGLAAEKEARLLAANEELRRRLDTGA